MNKILSWFSYLFLRPIFGLLFVKEIKGKENIPKRNFILVSNHLSYLDILCDCYVLVPRKFHFIGQIDGFKGIIKKIVQLAYFVFGVIPVERNNLLSRKKAFERAVEFLKKGDIVALYPEGTRSRQGILQEGKQGPAKLFLKTNVPILPVGLSGTYQLMPPGKIFPKIKRIIKINIGKPLCFEKDYLEAQNLDPESLAYKEILQKITNKMMEELSLLI